MGWQPKVTAITMRRPAIFTLPVIPSIATGRDHNHLRTRTKEGEKEKEQTIIPISQLQDVCELDAKPPLGGLKLFYFGAHERWESMRDSEALTVSIKILF